VPGGAPVSPSRIGGKTMGIAGAVLGEGVAIPVKIHEAH